MSYNSRVKFNVLIWPHPSASHGQESWSMVSQCIIWPAGNKLARGKIIID